MSLQDNGVRGLVEVGDILTEVGDSGTPVVLCLTVDSLYINYIV